MAKRVVGLYPVLTTALTFLICLLIVFSTPYSSFGGLWLYKISVGSLGSALPTLSPAPPSTVGLPDEYYVGLWTYCAASPSASNTCPYRPFIPFFFFDLASTIFSDLGGARGSQNARISDVQTNIFLPSSIYPFSSQTPLSTSSNLGPPKIFAFVACAAYLIAIVSASAALLTLVRRSPFSTSRSSSSSSSSSTRSPLRRLSATCALSLVVGALASTLQTTLVLFALSDNILLASNPVQINLAGFVLILYPAALVGIYYFRTIILSLQVLAPNLPTSSSSSSSSSRKLRIPLVKILGLSSADDSDSDPDPPRKHRPPHLFLPTSASSSSSSSALLRIGSAGSRSPAGGSTPTRARSSASLSTYSAAGGGGGESGWSSSGEELVIGKAPVSWV